MDLDRAFSLAIEAAASELDGASAVKESRLEEALATALVVSGLRARRQHHLEVRKEVWAGRLGAADLAIEVDDDQPALIEVKWGGSALWNCSWDVVKLATALVEARASAAYLLAAAAAPDWDRGVRGATLFADRDWRLEELLDQHSADFAFWREDVATYPRRLAAAWRTEVISIAELEVGGERYRILAARIDVEDGSLKRVRYHPRPEN